MSGPQVLGWGTALPDGRRTNDDLADHLGVDGTWITERTGIHTRRIGSTTTDLAVLAGREALDRAGVDPATVDLVLVATCTPDRTLPATANLVQAALGTGGGAFDLNAACSGFVLGLMVADGLLGAAASRILLIGSETLSRITDPDDRGTAILFGDGAAAVLLQAGDDGTRLLAATDVGGDGTLAPLLACDLGGTMAMDGREIFRRAVRATVDSATRCLERANLRADDIALVVPHQANLRIIDAAAERLGVPVDRHALVLADTGNTSAASVPLALAAALDQGRVRDGDHLLLVGFGAGMSWASAVLRWPGTGVAA